MSDKTSENSVARRVVEFLGRVIGRSYATFLRPLAPKVRPAIYAGIPVAEYIKLGDLLVKNWTADMFLGDIPEYESGLVEGIQRNIRSNDNVLVIGGGVGVVTSLAALQSSPNGRVTCYEGSKKEALLVRRTAEINAVANRVTVIHAVVGEALHVYGAQPNEKPVSAVDLPPCDVLIMDCEGAELNILRQMSLRPRVILVEAHGAYGAPTKTVAEMPGVLGYVSTNLGVAEDRLAAYCIENDIYVLEARLEA